MRLVFSLFVVLVCSACASPEQIAARQEAERQDFLRREAAYNAGLRQQCESIGYKPNTDPWRNCLVQLHTANQQNNAALRAAIIQEAMRQNAQQQQPAYRPVPQPRTPVYTNCTRDLLGNVNCVTQ